MNPVEKLSVAASGLAVCAAFAGTMVSAALGPSSQLFGHTLIAGQDPAELALTFDDGPNGDTTLALLDLLAANHARATFFMIGKWVRQQPQVARRVHAAGHLIGNHTDTHPWLHAQPARIIREELTACQQALEDTLGAPVRYFRPPHGARRPYVLSYARELGLTTVQWNTMAWDWRPIGSASMLANVDRGMVRASRRGRGSNVLLHDGSDRALGADRADTLAITAALLERCRTADLRTVRVDAWG